MLTNITAEDDYGAAENQNQNQLKMISSGGNSIKNTASDLFVVVVLDKEGPTEQGVR
ncbi:hypothetical protein ETB97_006927 [Aspergillus alliaceus]|uniref:Uncharacterized protein n=1 Tax=Petromyces alliaceus TaxID=209559 RepID=A0A8H6AE60_PETAA|nr:hypothetical protein ETB97_006927 [Aspergillus burnettii]